MSAYKEKNNMARYSNYKFFFKYIENIIILRFHIKFSEYRSLDERLVNSENSQSMPLTVNGRVYWDHHMRLFLKSLG